MRSPALAKSKLKQALRVITPIINISTQSNQQPLSFTPNLSYNNTDKMDSSGKGKVLKQANEAVPIFLRSESC
jgi:hypothetical protein